jgi:hypothetical protein
MMGALSLLTGAVFAAWSVRSATPRETNLVLSTVIARPVDVVFDVVSSRAGLPAWRRKPLWLPPALRLTLMTPGGEHSRGAASEKGSRLEGSEEIWIRHLKNREFGYKSVRRNDLSYESTFHFMPEDGKCLLVWEVSYRVRRLPDLLGRPLLDAAARAGMAGLLEWIRRLALSNPESSRVRSLIYEARRDQVPAA